MADPTNKAAVEAGQAVYTKRLLSIYDILVLGLSNSFVWNCSTKKLRKVFEDNASLNHLDVGVGTGYYPDKCLDDSERRLALFDLNDNSLSESASRNQRFSPEVYKGNVFEPLKLSCEKFDSISLNYLLHCLPGDMKDKAKVFKNLAQWLNEDGVLFGSTILGKGYEKGFSARVLMDFYNRKGVFDNLEDDVEGLENALKQSFKDVEIEVENCVAIFIAREKK
ncbi:methyltransferase domain-containing protein [Shewanella sp. 202IG2-18]|uniref:class I SAM-dependent methyltransferase n=1 Tax=Parashewanella hymeniacidonis TaxID=2807618 RepID=UPI0019603F5E|nr:class I SAM-dependent methyltransferase [Parashewanella hymeniacidonis]MBM7070506.1 methyltransferase domain-containing protein [Parashewanella hymeniacidonis]